MAPSRYELAVVPVALSTTVTLCSVMMSSLCAASDPCLLCEGRALGQSELAEDDGGGTEAGEGGLHQVEADKRRQEQPIGADQPCEREARKDHHSSKGEDSTVDVHDGPFVARRAGYAREDLVATSANDMARFAHGALVVLDIYAHIRIFANMKLKLALMASAADRAGELLKALANRHRLLILCQLIEGERSVGELAEFLCIRDSSVSQHLALLRKDDLVAARRDGQTIWYSIASTEARAVLTALYGIYCEPPVTRETKPARKRAKPASRRLARGQ